MGVCPHGPSRGREGVPSATVTTSQPAKDDDLFAGTAEYYARYRQDYPDAVYAELARAFQPDGSGTLLDLGTGTGQIALHLAGEFERVVALDVSQEMLAQASRVAAERGVTNIEWRWLAAENLAALDGTPLGGPYRIATLGSAFHWMDQPRVLDLLADRIEPGGGVFITALPGFIQPDNVEVGDDLARVIVQVVREYLGERRRAGSGYYGAPPRPWLDYLEESRFVDAERGWHRLDATFDLDGIVGLLFSTSFANKRILGERAEAFEADLRRALLTLEPSGRYHRS